MKLCNQFLYFASTSCGTIQKIVSQPFSQRINKIHISQVYESMYSGNISGIPGEREAPIEIAVTVEHLHTQVRKVGHHSGARMFALLCLGPAH